MPNVYNELSGIGPIWITDPEGTNPQRYLLFIYLGQDCVTGADVTVSWQKKVLEICT